ncbi:MAG: hypothetical protein QOE30_2897 [Mycobacterium sp.]|jgi:hypothetical protein|uniref:hypothetical protein n=1 Tax=Mycobacterium sp. TaxID=1785 RepID=UPI0028B5165D|nr:hypothetical protein [Mycobacterium sp.]MDT5117158.1 hypothetical protein [Mycobacterium sp.]
MWRTGAGDGWGRHVRGSSRATAGAEVVLAGWQDATAAVEWHAILFAADVELDATALRQHAAALIEAADEMERLSDGTRLTPARA